MRTVLLVDDLDVQLRVWARELEDLHVLSASNRADACALAREQHADVAIVDLFLGRENGMDVVRDLRAIDPDLYIVLVSADMSVAYAMAAVRAGADDVFVKPLKCAQIVRAIEEARPSEPDLVAGGAMTLDEVEWEHISRALLDCGDNITQAAQRLGIYRQTLQRKLRKRGRESAE